MTNASRLCPWGNLLISFLVLCQVFSRASGAVEEKNLSVSITFYWVIRAKCSLRRSTCLRRPLHNYATQSPLVIMGCPKFSPKTPPSPLTIITSSNTHIPQLTPLTTPKSIRIQSVILPQYTFWTDRETHRQTDSWSGQQASKNSTYTVLD